MPQDPSSMPGMTPAFMNQPQYQQQMQGLAMQVRQQEEGTKKIKKFLKAYEDIQLSAPMMQPQAPQQPSFMGGGGQPPMMQAPGGRVASGNNNLPRNDMTEPAPTSFTEMAGGSMPSEGPDDMTSYSGEEVPPEPEYETANIGEEEAMGGNPSQPYGPNRDAQGKPYDSPTMTRGIGLSMNPNVSPEEQASRAQNQAESDAYERRMGITRKRLEGKIESRDKREDKVPLEQRGDKEAMDPDRQYQRKRSDNTSRWLGQSKATLKEHDKRDGLRDVIKGLKATIEKVTDTVDKTFRPNTYHYDGKTWVINEQGPDWDSKSGKAAKTEIAKINASVKKLEQQVEGSKKKQDKISSSKPNKALGFAGIGAGLLAGTQQAGATAFPPEDAEIFLGRISKDKDFARLNAREKAAVQKYLEYKAESDSIDARVDVPKGRAGRMDEPIEYTSAEKALRSQ